MERGKLVSVGLVFILTMIFFLLFLYDTYNYNYQINKDKTWIYDFHREFPLSQEDIKKIPFQNIKINQLRRAGSLLICRDLSIDILKSRNRNRQSSF